MSTIKQFNQILNASDTKRFELWKPYRKRLTSFIFECIKNQKNQSLIILGAGNLDDIDLDLFSHLFDTITLTDVDMKALEHAKHKYKKIAHKIELKEIEYTGLKDSDHWNNFINKMLLYNSKLEIKQYFLTLIREIKNYKFTCTSRYDVVIITPIYTQLLLQQLLKDISILQSLNYPKHLLNYIQRQVLDIMPIVIQTFNKNIDLLLNKKAILCVISDIFETNISSDFYAEVKPLLNNPIKINDFHLNYIKTYGIGAGDFGLDVFKSSKSIKKSQWFEWPFDKDKCIFVQAICFNNSK